MIDIEKEKNNEMILSRFDAQEIFSRFDAQERACFYTLLRDSKRYTVRILRDDLDRHGDDVQARRDVLAAALEARLSELPDPEPAPAQNAPPAREPAEGSAVTVAGAGT